MSLIAFFLWTAASMVLAGSVGFFAGRVAGERAALARVQGAAA